MIMVSGLRASLVIGLRVTPSKIQHDGSRWNRKFGSGGSSMLVGSADSHTSPTSWATSALVIPPIKNSATSAASAVLAHSRARSAAPMPTSRSLRMCSHAQSLTPGSDSASASRRSTSYTSTPRSRITSQNASCSCLALLTHKTSSKSSSSAFDGVSLVCSRPGRCTITLRSWPTSECTPSAIVRPPRSSTMAVRAPLSLRGGRPGVLTLPGVTSGHYLSKAGPLLFKTSGVRGCLETCLWYRGAAPH